MFTPITLKDLVLSFTNKICFEDFTTTIYPGSRIAIIGNNGNGKSCLLNILRQTLKPTSGQITVPSHISIGYVEQVIDEFDTLSGGQRFNKRLSEALGAFPDLLLLDEPTNHLDTHNRKQLIAMLQRYQGTLIVVSHDIELLRQSFDTLWHIDKNKVHIFNGRYDDYIKENQLEEKSIKSEISKLKQGKKKSHQDLMREQVRAKKSKAYGEKKYADDRMALQGARAQGQMTCNKNNKFLANKKEALLSRLNQLYTPEVIRPNFSLTADTLRNGPLLTVREASIGYKENQPILNNISLSLTIKSRVALRGKNASGKSTLVKAILNDKAIIRSGDWFLPKINTIGYLDQHYALLNPRLSVFDHLSQLRPDWNDAKKRRHLNDFIFRNNEIVYQSCEKLSGGEKVRACLSFLAAKTPRLLILDEVTNNLDLETKAHITQVLQAYPGALMVISHEQAFLDAINIELSYLCEDGHLKSE